MEDTPETPVPLSTNGDLVQKIKALRRDLGMCNVDKAALRLWAEELRKQ